MSEVVHSPGHGHPEPRPFTRLRHLLAPERRDLGVVVVFALAVAILSLATPITVESLVNTVAFGVLLWPVLVLGGVLLVCLGLAAAIRAMQVYVVECLQRRLFVRVVADYAHRLPRLRMESFDRRYGPELINRFFDVMNLQKALATLLLDGLAIVVTAVVGMIVLGFYHPFLLGFDIILILLIAFALFVLGWNGVRSSLQESHVKYEVAGWLEELLRCLRLFKFARGSALAIEKADQLASSYVALRRDHFRVVWRQTLFSLGLQVIASTTLLGIGGYLVIHRQLTLGQLVAAELIVALVVASVAKLGKYAEAYYDLMAASEKLGLITDLPLERESGEELKDNGSGVAIRLHGVADASGRSLPELQDWTVAENERVAIVGPPGSGKTTFFEILCGLREPARGVVELDGIDIRGLSLGTLRDQVAIVEGPEVFLGSVLENIRVGRNEITPAEVREALQAVSLLNVVHSLPQGLDTPVIPGGGPLSAGQFLRLTLARALVGRPRLLILDGALDALDLSECPDLLDRLFAPQAPWTLLIATAEVDLIRRCHRTVRFANPHLPSASTGGSHP